MRILGIGEYHSLGEMYRRLALAGHEVQVYVEMEEAHSIFAGINRRCADVGQGLDWLRAAGDEGIVIFECASKGEWQDQLRREGLRVIGSSAWGDRLENDRVFGQQVLREAGLDTATVHDFSDFAAAAAFIRRHPGAYVYKPGGSEVASTETYIGELNDGADMLAWLANPRGKPAIGVPRRFVLMERLQGVEVGIGGYFDGRRFLHPLCLDWEHKRFFPGDLGELTGEMGTLVTYRGYERLFAATLARLVEPLRAGGYLGYINLNTIINERGIWPLEFTTRFGYPGFAVCGALQIDGWDSIFRSMLDRRDQPKRFATHDGFALGVVLTVPPFPYEDDYATRSKGAPIFFRSALSEVERAQLYYAEVAMNPPQPDGQLVADGSLGYLMVATGCGVDAGAARDAAYVLTQKVVVRNVRYRNDIGDNFIRRDRATLRQLGLLD